MPKVTEYKCSDCGKVFLYKSTRDRHVIRKHQNVDQDFTQIPSASSTDSTISTASTASSPTSITSNTATSITSSNATPNTSAASIKNICSINTDGEICTPNAEVDVESIMAHPSDQSDETSATTDTTLTLQSLSHSARRTLLDDITGSNHPRTIPGLIKSPFLDPALSRKIRKKRKYRIVRKYACIISGCPLWFWRIYDLNRHVDAAHRYDIVESENGFLGGEALICENESERNLYTDSEIISQFPDNHILTDLPENLPDYLPDNQTIITQLPLPPCSGLINVQEQIDESSHNIPSVSQLQWPDIPNCSQIARVDKQGTLNRHATYIPSCPDFMDFYQ